MHFVPSAKRRFSKSIFANIEPLQTFPSHSSVERLDFAISDTKWNFAIVTRAEASFFGWIFNGLVSQSSEFFIHILWRFFCQSAELLWQRNKPSRGILAASVVFIRFTLEEIVEHFRVVFVSRLSRFHESNHVGLYFIFILQYWFSNSYFCSRPPPGLVCLPLFRLRVYPW